MKYVALAILLSLILGLPTVHFQHHLNLPKLDGDKITSSIEVNTSFPFYHRVTHVRLKTELKGNDTQRDVYKLLDDAKEGDVIVFNLAGFGGDGFTLFQLVDDIKKTKAHTIMIVESPVFSAHAYLAVSGNELIMEPLTFLMFHTMSSYGQDCTKETGTDRTVSNVEHCFALQATMDQLATKFVSDTAVLTMEEKLLILTGHDVYITPEIYAERVRKHEQ